MSTGTAVAGLAAAAVLELALPALLSALAACLALLAAATALRHCCPPGCRRHAEKAGAVAGRAVRLGSIRADLSRELSGRGGVPALLSICQACIPVLVIVSLGVAGAFVGSFRAAGLQSWPQESFRDPVAAGVTVVALTSRDDQVFARLDDGPLKGRKVLLTLPAQPNDGGDASGTSLSEGMRLRVRGRFRPPEPPGDGGFDQRAYLLRKGAVAVLQAREVTPAGRRGGLSGGIDSLRREAREHLTAGLSLRFSGLLQGVILGEQAKLDEADIEAFRASGTAHILSVSGLHVASLASLVLVGGAAARLPRAVVTLSAALLATLFVPLTGASPPVLRATLLFLLVLLAEGVGMGRDRYQVLLITAAAILTANPYGITDPGFQLSFAAAASMLVMTRRIEGGLGFLPQALRQGLAVSAAATLGTAPISLFTFGQVSLSGIGANLLVVPLLPLLMALGLGSVAAGFLSHHLAALLNQPAAILLSWLCVVAHGFGRLPLLQRAHLWDSLAWAAGFFVALPASAALLRRPPPFELRSSLMLRIYAAVHGRRDIRPRGRVLLALAVPLIMGSAAIGVERSAAGLAGSAQAWARGRDWPSAVELRVLDVGEGSAALLRTPSGRSVLFDAGPAGAGLEGELRSLGVQRLDLVVLSHPHADHFAGLEEVLGSVRVERLIDHVETGSAGAPSSPGPEQQGQGGRLKAASQEEREAHAYRSLRLALTRQGTAVTRACDGLRVYLDGVTIELRAPPKPVVLPVSQDPNDSSLVALVRHEGTDILLPGDAEARALARYRLPPVTALVLPHHGSKGAVTRSFLNRLSPEVAVVSVGEDNSFGHPHAEVMQLLQQAAVPVLRTDERGWVALRLGSWGLAAESEKPANGFQAAPVPGRGTSGAVDLARRVGAGAR